MLGSLLDQDEIEEFMAEADAVTHNNFLLDPVTQVPGYTWVYVPDMQNKTQQYSRTQVLWYSQVFVGFNLSDSFVLCV